MEYAIMPELPFRPEEINKKNVEYIPSLTGIVLFIDAYTDYIATVVDDLQTIAIQQSAGNTIISAGSVADTKSDLFNSIINLTKLWNKVLPLETAKPAFAEDIINLCKTGRVITTLEFFRKIKEKYTKLLTSSDYNY